MSSIKKKISLRSFGALALAVICLSLFGISSSLATDYYWIGSSGDWSDPANWNPGVPQPGGEPNFEHVYLTQSDATNRTVNCSAVPPGGYGSTITIDATGTGTMTLSISAGSGIYGLNYWNIGLNGTGIVSQTGNGVGALIYNPYNYTLGVNPGSNGIYNLSDGYMFANHLVVGGGGTGTFNQSGGTLDLDQYLTVNPLGTYNLSGTGTVEGLNRTVSAHETISGIFNQSGGLNRNGVVGFNEFLEITGGTYNLNGGSVGGVGGIFLAGATYSSRTMGHLINLMGTLQYNN